MPPADAELKLALGSAGASPSQYRLAEIALRRTIMRIVRGLTAPGSPGQCADRCFQPTQRPIEIGQWSGNQILERADATCPEIMSRENL